MAFSNKTRMTLLVAAVVAMSGVAAYTTHAATADTEQAHVAAATAAAGQDLKSRLQLCTVRPPGRGPRPADNTAPPMKIFDNLYFVGIPSVSSWAITTSQGIIVIDTLDNASEAENFIEAGLRKVGLDPSQIKYIIITHAHPDHFGGAQYLADKFHPTLVMSATDWDVLAMPQTIGRRDPAVIPKRGTSMKDGDKLTLGDTTIDFVETPPHTPGTMSLVFPVKEGNQRHVAALWGGISFNFELTDANLATYYNSVVKFSKVAQARGADVPLANHSNFDDAFEKMAALKARKPGDPNPFVMGWAGQERIFTIQEQCTMAARARVRTATAK
jgi:metallo-beta-lactamase class B